MSEPPFPAPHEPRRWRWLAWVGGVLVVLVVGVPLLVLGLLNTGFGQRAVERIAARATGGMVVLGGLHGRLPDAVRLDRLELRDAKGTWLTASGMVLDWSPTALLGRTVHVERLTVAMLAVARAPVPSGKAAPAGNSGISLPVRVRADLIDVARVELGAPLAGAPAVLALTGSADVGRFAAGHIPDGNAALTVRRLDKAGVYNVQAVLTQAAVKAQVSASEPDRGLVGMAAGLPALGAIGLSGAVDGPWNAAGLRLALAAGALRAGVTGTADLPGKASKLDVRLDAPAMQPAPGMGWQTLALVLHQEGPWAHPAANGTIAADGIAAAGVTVGSIRGTLQADTHKAGVVLSLHKVALPPPNEGLLAAGDAVVTAGVVLDDAALPVTVALAHPLIDGTLVAHVKPAFGGRLTLAVPDLGVLAKAAGRDVQGSAQAVLEIARQGTASRFDLDAGLAVTGGTGVPPGARGTTHLAASVTLDGQDIDLTRLVLDGTSLHVTASGHRHGQQVAAVWDVASRDVAALAEGVRGQADLRGHMAGTQAEFTADAVLDGTLGVKAMAPGPVHLVLHGEGLPGKPAGSVTGTAGLAGATASLNASATRDGAGGLHVVVAKADWKSLAATADLVLAKGAALPVGTVNARFTRLADAAPLVGRPVAGAVTLQADIKAGGAGTIDLRGRGVGLPGTATVDALTLVGTITDAAGTPGIAGKLTASGVHAGAIGGDVTAAANGRLAALGLTLAARLTGVAGQPAQADARAVVDVPAHVVTLSSLTAAWHGEQVVLAGPARVMYAPGVSVDRLAVAVRADGAAPARLEVAGSISPALKLTVDGRNITPALARPFAPDVQADGTMTVAARLGGTVAVPTGTVTVRAVGMRARTGVARSLPAADLSADLALAGATGRIDARLVAGSSNHLAVTGTVPLRGAGALGLQADGTLGLALLDPILTAQGRRVRGTVVLEARIGGTVAAPAVAGTLRWSGGELQDYAQGLHITDIDALIGADGQTVRVEHFSGKAGGGTVGVSGTVGLAGSRPVDLAIRADNARPIASDLLTATLDADLRVRGDLTTSATLSGKVHVRRADIQVPDRLPTSVAVLDVRRPGDKPPAKGAGPGLALPVDLTIEAPQQVFVRGHGLDAELGGTLHMGGTLANLRTSGGIDMREGNFSLAGQNLTFTSGTISFNGAAGMDPALDLVATESLPSITATLTVGGYASAPKITLSSVPDRPQDEILAALLFHQSSASLGPLQLAEIAAALAQVSGLTGGGPDPLSRLRKGLGLDRLSVGSSGSGSTAATTVEAGRYVAPGIYVGAKQGTSSAAGTQAEVQIDLTKGLKLQTGVGNGPGANSVGLTYQFQY